MVEPQSSTPHRERSAVETLYRHAESYLWSQALALRGVGLDMTTHGRSGLHHWAMGSVADKVLHSTTTPLVLIHPHPI